MKILQQPVRVKKFQRVLVHFNKPCTIYMMTEVNFRRYKDGASFRRMGGKFEESPVEFVVPYDGTWHAVIEKGSHFNPLNIEGRVEILPPKRKEVPYYAEEEENFNEPETPENDEVSNEIVDDSSSEEQEEEEEDDKN